MSSSEENIQSVIIHKSDQNGNIYLIFSIANSIDINVNANLALKITQCIVLCR